MNKKAFYPFSNSAGKEEIKVEVEVLETKQQFGRKMCRITPVRGEGSFWVNQENVIIK